MCGIAGKLNFDAGEQVDPGLIRRMTDVIAHRGPDGQGCYASGPVGLGHRRLSIIDLSPTGAQPMTNEDRRVWVVFNGEIYNYQALRQDLLARGHIFRSATDTEVIIHLYEEYGVECLPRLRGMFAFAIWDERSRELLLARDRVGIKPLYYHRSDHALTFGSEIKSLLVDPSISRQVDPQVVGRFLTFLYLPGSETLLQGIRKLAPGSFLRVRGARVTEGRYWDLRYQPTDRWRNLEDAATELSSLIRRTVRDHMISDVPVGFLASGGVDSTALLSYAVEETDKPISTFTVGFEGQEFADERPFARLASQRFGTLHHEITISADDFREFLPAYVWHMEEPVCEPPAIALYYVSKLAREHVKVLLSGEGGDEAFGGYPEYRNYLAFERLKGFLGPLRPGLTWALAAAARLRPTERLKKYARFAALKLPEYFLSRRASPHDHFNRHRGLLCGKPSPLNPPDSARPTLVQDLFAEVAGQPLLNQMLFVDTKTWLPDDLLIKADKMTMATSVELRVPFLDHEVLEFAASLPVDFKVRGRETKRVLKQAFSSRVPQEILHRRKTGFPVPFNTWLRGDLREFSVDVLTSAKALGRGYFDPGQVRAMLDAHAHRGCLGDEVFSLLVLELWHQRFVDPVHSDR